jgi:hypothetical protein
MLSSKLLVPLIAFLLLAGTACAQQVSDLDFIVYRNGSVELYFMRVYEGQERPGWASSSDYMLVIEDSQARVAEEEALPVTFFVLSDPPEEIDGVPVSVTLPYSSDWATVKVYENDTLLYQKDIKTFFCNRDGACGENENHVSCPADCPPAAADGWCNKAPDSMCDPDCAPGLDRDCGAPDWTYAIIAGVIIVMLVLAILLYRRPRPAA